MRRPELWEVDPCWVHGRDKALNDRSGENLADDVRPVETELDSSVAISGNTAGRTRIACRTSQGNSSERRRAAPQGHAPCQTTLRRRASSRSYRWRRARPATSGCRFGRSRHRPLERRRESRSWSSRPGAEAALTGRTHGGDRCRPPRGPLPGLWCRADYKRRGIR